MCVDIVFLPRSLKVAFGLQAAIKTPTSPANLLVFPYAPPSYRARKLTQ